MKTPHSPLTGRKSASLPSRRRPSQRYAGRRTAPRPSAQSSAIQLCYRTGGVIPWFSVTVRTAGLKKQFGKGISNFCCICDRIVHWVSKNSSTIYLYSLAFFLEDTFRVELQVLAVHMWLIKQRCQTLEQPEGAKISKQAFWAMFEDLCYRYERHIVGLVNCFFFFSFF